jgi:hypothetical protein
MLQSISQADPAKKRDEAVAGISFFLKNKTAFDKLRLTSIQICDV